MTKKELPLQEEVSHFIADDKQYVAVMLSGRAIKIVRSRSFQPPIVDQGQYSTYLWVESIDGFFLFRQDIFQGIAGTWILDRQVIPEAQEQSNFFFDYLDEWTNMEKRGEE